MSRVIVEGHGIQGHRPAVHKQSAPQTCAAAAAAIACSTAPTQSLALGNGQVLKRHGTALDPKDTISVIAAHRMAVAGHGQIGGDVGQIVAQGNIRRDVDRVAGGCAADAGAQRGIVCSRAGRREQWRRAQTQRTRDRQRQRLPCGIDRGSGDGADIRLQADDFHGNS
ncbi:MAG: hypothetical protein KDI50_05020 [Candidatus Competibacteraceae bacterium]|nr:hypothetical protein [Candidatus Competibacteraceae bacterium]